jgi:hypothetical protein
MEHEPTNISDHEREIAVQEAEIARAIGDNRDVDTYDWTTGTKPVDTPAFFAIRSNAETNEKAYLIAVGIMENGQPALPKGAFSILAFTRDEWDAFVMGSTNGEFDMPEDTATDQPQRSERSVFHTSDTPEDSGQKVWPGYWADDNHILRFPGETADESPHIVQAVGEVATGEAVRPDTL